MEPKMSMVGESKAQQKIDNACECEESELRDIATLKEDSLCPKCKVGQLKKMQKAIS